MAEADRRPAAATAREATVDGAAAPLVSVVMPAYQVAPFVAEAVESLRVQTWPALELIVVDDGSTDATGEIVAAAAPAWETPGRRLRLVRQANAGAAAARNVGLALVEGAFVAFLDSDDRNHPRLIERLVAELDAHADLDLAFAGCRFVDESGTLTLAEGRPGRRRFGPADLLEHSFVHAPLARAVAVRATGRFDEGLGACIDLDFYVRLARLRPGNVGAVAEVLSDYRRRAGQITGDWRRMERNWTRMLDKYHAQDPAFAAAVARRARSFHQVYWSALAYQAGDYAASRRLIASAWAGAPLKQARDRHAWVRAFAALASLLPGPVHRRIAHGFNAARRRLGLDFT